MFFFPSSLYFINSNVKSIKKCMWLCSSIFLSAFQTSVHIETMDAFSRKTCALKCNEAMNKTENADREEEKEWKNE